MIRTFLRRLADVAVTAPADGDALVYDAGTGKWVNGAAGGGGGAPTGAAGGVLSGTYPDPGFAADMATQAELNTHAADTTAVHGITDTSVLETTTGSQAKVDAAVAALLNSAPGALDTLDELAAALGDDANFASTVTTALAGKQTLDSDLTAIAALTTTTFGRALLALADQAALLSAAGAAAASHAHSGADITSGTVLDARIDSAIARDSEVTSAIAALSSVYQPLDSDLTSIAALTTTSFGRAFLALADAAAGRTALGLGTLATQSGTFSGTSSGTNTGDQDLSGLQPLDSDLTSIAALSTTSYGRAFLALADAAAARTALSLGTLATQSGTFSGTSSGTNTGDQTLPTTLPPNGAAGGGLTGTYPNPTIADAELLALAGLTSAANKGIQFTGSGTAATYDLTAAGKALLDDADAAAQLTTLGVSTFIQTLLDDTTAAAARTTLGVVSETIGWTWVTKGADESVASSTTLQDDDALFFTAANGGVYEFSLILIYASPVGTGTPDIKIAVGEDATIRGYSLALGVSGSESTGLTQSMTSFTTTAVHGTAAADRAMHLFGTHAGGGGTFKVQWAQNTSGANATTVRSASVLRYRRLN